jgi:hypothetical protein
MRLQELSRSSTGRGHIRNDTRDVSRRIAARGNRLICRRKHVARDRACTRVTPRNLHGRGVDGSSPSEGFAKAPHVGAFSFRATCSGSNVRWVWSPLWSLQVGRCLCQGRKNGDIPPEVGVNGAASEFHCLIAAPRDSPLLSERGSARRLKRRRRRRNPDEQVRRDPLAAALCPSARYSVRATPRKGRHRRLRAEHRPDNACGAHA